MSVLDILLQKNLLTREAIREVRKQTGAGTSLEEALISQGVKPEDIIAARGEFLNIPVRSLADVSIPFEALDYIPEESALTYGFAPIGLKEGALEVGVTDPDNMEARDALNFLAAQKNIPYKIFLITLDDFKKVIDTYKGMTGEVSKALSELETELSVETDSVRPDTGAQGTSKEKSGEENTLIVEDAPVVKIVATIVRYAVEGEASDVHIEHMRDKVRVRFRVDGVLNTSLVLPPQVHSAVVARIKVLSNMRLDENRTPQDGRFSARIDGRRIDFRVSTFPAYHGEKVVMRILDQAKGVRTLEQVGFSAKNLALVRASQSQVRPEIGYTFASGLRTTLRQDPDVIMVGEIRDKETAQLAVQAALTGHLVFSTLHTNSAAGVIPRLIDMGVDPYLIAPTLILSIGQRLAGMLVPGGGEAVKVDGSIKAMIDEQFADLPEQYKKEITFSDTVYKIKPTPESPKGVRGRMAVFEMFEMDKQIEQAILTSPTETAITKILRAKGMITIKEDAIIKAFEKKIPFEEVNKL